MSKIKHVFQGAGSYSPRQLTGKETNGSQTGNEWRGGPGWAEVEAQTCCLALELCIPIG
jgi:hypothetical protein